MSIWSTTYLRPEPAGQLLVQLISREAAQEWRGAFTTAASAAVVVDVSVAIAGVAVSWRVMIRA